MQDRTACTFRCNTENLLPFVFPCRSILGPFSQLKRKPAVQAHWKRPARHSPELHRGQETPESPKKRKLTSCGFKLSVVSSGLLLQSLLKRECHKLNGNCCTRRLPHPDLTLSLACCLYLSLRGCLKKPTSGSFIPTNVHCSFRNCCLLGLRAATRKLWESVEGIATLLRGQWQGCSLNAA